MGKTFGHQTSLMLGGLSGVVYKIVKVSNTMFRQKVHFRWLSSVYDWNKASKAFREKYYVMYDIQECLGCRTRYKDAPGLMKRGTALRFYSESADEGHPGYCSHYCAQRCGAYFDPLDDWQA